jgi:hypothetical protein
VETNERNSLAFVSKSVGARQEGFTMLLSLQIEVSCYSSPRLKNTYSISLLDQRLLPQWQHGHLHGTLQKPAWTSILFFFSFNK